LNHGSTLGSESDPMFRVPTIKSARELDSMRAAGKVVAAVRERLIEVLEPGMTTGDLDQEARKVISDRGAEPSFLGYAPIPGAIPFPGVICTSLNEEIVHGIPGDRVILDGDLVKLDIGAVVDGFHGDSAITLIAGDGDAEKKELVEVTRRALEQGILAAVVGARVGDISAAVEGYVRPLGFELVREYTGHGIGRRLHEAPQIPNVGVGGQGPQLREGMVICIEPMVNLGTWRTESLGDGWTVVTADRKLSAHFEHTLAITPEGPEILTVL